MIRMGAVSCDHTAESDNHERCLAMCPHAMVSYAKRTGFRPALSVSLFFPCFF